MEAYSYQPEVPCAGIDIALGRMNNLNTGYTADAVGTGVECRGRIQKPTAQDCAKCLLVRGLSSTVDDTG